MRNISVPTTQNVHIDYELATLGQRAAAFILDFIVIAIGSFLYIQVFSSVMDSVWSVLPLFFWLWFYSLANELLFHGRSLGKLVLNLRIIRVDGKETGFTEYFLRWVFRGVDIYGSLGALGGLLIASTGKMQRMGDLLADTVVVRGQSTSVSGLRDLMQLRNSTNHEIRYPMVHLLGEEDAMLIRQALIQARRLNNRAHQEMIRSLAIHLRDILGISDDNTPPREFLRRIVDDYVVITR
jgi:uncharacterized RDD family membrane protein YckC